MKTTMKKLVFAALAALACAVVPSSAADGNEYYDWATAPMDHLIASYTFDDAGNGGLNLLPASLFLRPILSPRSSR